MTQIALGVVEPGDIIVHVTRGLNGTRALCGHAPIQYVTGGIGPGQGLCCDCGEALDNMEGDPSGIKLMLLESAPTEAEAAQN